MSNKEDITKELKELRNELFQLKLKQQLIKDNYSKNKYREQEKVVRDSYKKLAFEKVSYKNKGEIKND